MGYYDYDDTTEAEDAFERAIEKRLEDEDEYQTFCEEWAGNRLYADSTEEEFEAEMAKAPSVESDEFRDFVIKRIERESEHDWFDDSEERFRAWERGYNAYLLRRGY